MRNIRPVIIWIILITTFVSFYSPVLPVHASGLDNLLGGGAWQNSLGTGSIVTLLGVFFGNILSKIFPADSGPVGDSGLPDRLESKGKKVLGFYAEWWDGDSSSYNDMVKHHDVLDSIIPYWITLYPDGSIKSRGGQDRAKVVNFAHQKSLNVILMVNNAHGNGTDEGIQTVLADSSLRKKAIDNIEVFIKDNKLDGVNIDFEMVPSAARNNLTVFMQELSLRLKPQGYSISIDVFPKQNENDDISIAYDYAALARVVDKLILMTYDNHGMWSGPGAIAGINWVENNLKYALNFIPKHKLYLGIAGYGYDWSSKGVASKEYKEITDLVDRYNATIQWDEASNSPYFYYTDSDGTKHTVWFENSYSTKYKLDLVNKYDLAGIALWKLGEEDPRDWDVFKDKLRK